MSSRLSLPVFAACVALVPATALPCGGMVFPQHESRLGGMSDQELLLAFTADQTVLVASVGYEGVDAADFAFVLPLATEPTEVRDGDPALFIALDEATAPRVSILDVDVSPPGVGCGGAEPGSGGAYAYTNEEEGMLRQRGRTETYEWVVIGGDTGTAISTWLGDEGYALTAGYAAALDAYAGDDWFFFAAKVRPGADTGALAPIELHLPPSAPETFRVPLALAAYSLRPDQPLGITTYVSSSGPVEPSNYATGQVSNDDLVALAEDRSNFDELERAILDEPEGAWIIDFADQLSVDALRMAYARGEEWGRVDPSASTVAEVDEFFERLGDGPRFVTRLRTELPADVLRDLELRAAALDPVSREYSVTFEEEDSTLCTVGRRGRVPPLLLLLLPVVAWLRSRRRALLYPRTGGSGSNRMRTRVRSIVTTAPALRSAS